MSANAPLRVLVHATSVVLGKTALAFGGPERGAILLLGPPGSGKSDVALRLIAAGAQLLSDDQTALFARYGKLFAEALGRTRGQMEIWGAGIVRVDGARAAPAARAVPVILAVRLDADIKIARMPEPATYAPPAPLKLSAAPPLVVLRPFEASTTAKIAAIACAAAQGRFVAGVGAANPK